jgi:high-affinity iron transporter
MLINTVILFIRDLLPIFILFCFFISTLRGGDIYKKTWLYIVFSSVLGIFITFYFYSVLSDLFDGFGIEIIKTIALILFYACLLFGGAFLVNQQSLTLLKQRIIIAGLVLFIIITASEFIVFLNSYITNTQSLRDIAAGLSIGLGICFSFSALFYFLLSWLKRKKNFTVLFCFLALFLSGQISQVVNLLQQVDIITNSEALWNSSNIIKDSSEYGHLFKTLLGYEASPSLEFVMFYALSLVIFFIIFYTNTSKKFKFKSATREDK